MSEKLRLKANIPNKPKRKKGESKLARTIGAGIIALIGGQAISTLNDEPETNTDQPQTPIIRDYSGVETNYFNPPRHVEESARIIENIDTLNRNIRESTQENSPQTTDGINDEETTEIAINLASYIGNGLNDYLRSLSEEELQEYVTAMQSMTLDIDDEDSSGLSTSDEITPEQIESALNELQDYEEPTNRENPGWADYQENLLTLHDALDQDQTEDTLENIAETLINGGYMNNPDGRSLIRMIAAQTRNPELSRRIYQHALSLENESNSFTILLRAMGNPSITASDLQ